MYLAGIGIDADLEESRQEQSSSLVRGNGGATPYWLPPQCFTSPRAAFNHGIDSECESLVF